MKTYERDGPLRERNRVELVCVPADFGHGANDGAYYPVGLLSVGTHLRKALPDRAVSVVDLHHYPDWKPSAKIVGISASSTLNYRNVLRVAEEAKARGSLVVLGGPHVSRLATQVLRNRPDTVDFVIRRQGEKPFARLLETLASGSDLADVPNLSWRREDGTIVDNHSPIEQWAYDDYLPLDFSLLPSGIGQYWQTFRERVDSSFDAALVVFTHFGCTYRQRAERGRQRPGTVSKWCSYCSLDNYFAVRTGDAIVADIIHQLQSLGVRAGAHILLKCYGDNVSTHPELLTELAEAIERCDEWQEYDLTWTFYAQSSALSERVADLLARIGTRNLFIGFDSADDEVQKINALGTSGKAHTRAAERCLERGIKIQAAFVVGCASETEKSLDLTLEFAEKLVGMGVLERINTAVMVVMPGAPNYRLLCEREPWIRELDDLPTEKLQRYWLKHFCPHLGENPSHGLEILRAVANQLDDLSPGPHASMGYVSDRFRKSQVRASVDE